MNFLVDNQLSPKVANGLREAGYDAFHVIDYQMAESADSDIFDRAEQENRVIISADTDFGTLLAMRQTNKPSVLLLRWQGLRRPADQLRIILANLPIGLIEK